MDVFQERNYYNINKFLLMCNGQWPFQTKMSSRCFLCLNLFLCANPVVTITVNLFKNANDLELFLDCIPPAMTVIGAIVKFTTHIVYSKKMLKLWNGIRDDWEIWSQEQEVTILQKYAQMGKNTALGFAVAAFAATTLFLSLPMLPKIFDTLFRNGTAPGLYPLSLYCCGIDEQKYYFYIMGYFIVCVLALLLNGIAAICTYIVYIHHACGICAAIGHKLSRIGEYEDPDSGSDKDFEILVTCIIRHNFVIEFMKLIEAIFSMGFAITVALNMGIISVTGFQIVRKGNPPQDTIRFASMIIIELLALFLECYYSQLIIDHSISIQDYIYEAKWYRVSLRSQKLLKLITMRCNRYCVITAGRIWEMSLETFLKSVQASVSYLTVLRSMQ